MASRRGPERRFFSLVDAHSIGVALNPSFLMVPRKSLSLAAGFGTHAQARWPSCDEMQCLREIAATNRLTAELLHGLTQTKLLSSNCNPLGRRAEISPERLCCRLRIRRGGIAGGLRRRWDLWPMQGTPHRRVALRAHFARERKTRAGTPRKELPACMPGPADEPRYSARFRWSLSLPLSAFQLDGLDLGVLLDPLVCLLILQ